MESMSPQKTRHERINMQNVPDSLMGHSVEICLFLSLFILTWTGVGDTTIAGLLGLLLCAMGILQRTVRVDLWVLIPLFLYNLFSMISSYLTYGNIADGYASTQLLYPVIYLTAACAGSRGLSLLRRLCVLWTGGVAAAGILQFVFRAVVLDRSGRLGGFLGNPNAMGIFLVLGWFALIGCGRDREENSRNILPYMEPLLLTALALTLSMGSFLAMAVGIGVLSVERKRHSSWQETFRYLCQLLARVCLGTGTGLLLYLAAARTDASWICLPLLLYTAYMTLCWKKFGDFLDTYPRISVWVAMLWVLVAVSLLLIRSSSPATFAERLEMMQSGLRYLTVRPLTGLGPYQWRLLDMQDGGKYFNTWHIHNVPLHVAVELGFPAMTMLLLIAVRFCRKSKSPAQKAGFAAFCFHNFMDTSFFYMGITTLLLLTVSDPDKDAGAVPRPWLLYGIPAVIFACNLCLSLAG